MPAWIAGLVGALIGAATGLVGALIVARSNRDTTLLAERRAVISATRERRVALYADTIALAWDLESIASFPPARRGDDMSKARITVSDMLVKKRLECGTLRAVLSLEPENDELASVLDKLSSAFVKSMIGWTALPDLSLVTPQQLKTVGPIRAYGRELLAESKRKIAVLDDELQTLLIPRKRTAWRFTGRSARSAQQ